MALIKINLNGAVVSESAKAPAYKVAKVGGATALVISSEHKPAVSKCISNARKAQKLALSALKNRIEANTIATVRVPREENAARKTKLRQRVKAMKTKAAADVKTAKELLREGTAALKAAGLSALSSPLKASDISLSNEPGRSARTVRAAQTDSLVVKGKKGYIKPKFLAASKFEALGQKTSTAKPGMGPRAAVKRVQKRKADTSPISKKSGKSLDSIEDELTARDKAKAKAKKAKAKAKGVSGATPGKRIDSYADAKVKSAITRFIKKPDADMSQLTDEELSYAHNSLLAKRESRANLGYGKKAGTLYNTDARKRVEAELARRKK